MYSVVKFTRSVILLLYGNDAIHLLIIATSGAIVFNCSI